MKHKQQQKNRGLQPERARVCPKCKSAPITRKTYDYCDTCDRHRTIKKQRAFKLACLKYKNERNPLECSRCHNEYRQDVLCLRHIMADPDNVPVSKLTGSANLSELVRSELDKCSVLCRNCEAALYRSKRPPTKLKKRALELRGGKCTDCGHSACAAALEFHHRDGRGAPTKRLTLGQRGLNRLGEIIDELRKVDILCSNCHAALHAIEKEEERMGELRSQAKASVELEKEIEEELAADDEVVLTANELFVLADEGEGEPD